MAGLSATRQSISAAFLLVLASLPLRANPSYRDLNHNGRLDAYEDAGTPIEQRIDDLLDQMTIEEKVGTMLHGVLAAPDSPIGISSTGYDLGRIAEMINDRHVNSFITRLTASPEVFAQANNQVQEIAARSRLGIPLTISTDPRNHFQAVAGASSTGGGFTLWPEPLGFAALRDSKEVVRFAQSSAREYRAVGMHMALSPQADLATEPRWARTAATFGSDPALVSKLAGAYVQGFQGALHGPTKSGVATVAKHWVGYGAEVEGYDGHNFYGRTARLDDRSFALHVRAFDGALRAKTAGIMPAYPIIAGVTFRGTPLEQVGAGYSHQLLTGMLRGSKGFDGLILSDWAITNDCPESCRLPTAEHPQTPRQIGMPWGMEDSSTIDRFIKGVNAGIDQFGGVDDPAAILEAVKQGSVPLERINESVRRILRLKFELGLFEQPYVEPQAAVSILASEDTKREAERVQAGAQVILENKKSLMPLRHDRRVWLFGVDSAAATAQGLQVVGRLEDAQVAIVRVRTPSEELHPNYFFGSRQHEGRLFFRENDPDFEGIRRASSAVPTIVVVDVDRPPILTNIRAAASALIAVFGATDSAVIEVIVGRSAACGRLPVEFPSSMNAVAAQDPAMPDDSRRPLYPRGYGLHLKSVGGACSAWSQRIENEDK